MGHALLGQILAGEGDEVAARREFELVLHKYPNDAAAVVARDGIDGSGKTDAPGWQRVCGPRSSITH